MASVASGSVDLTTADGRALARMVVIAWLRERQVHREPANDPQDLALDKINTVQERIEQLRAAVEAGELGVVDGVPMIRNLRNELAKVERGAFPRGQGVHPLRGDDGGPAEVWEHLSVDARRGIITNVMDAVIVKPVTRPAPPHQPFGRNVRARQTKRGRRSTQISRFNR